MSKSSENSKYLKRLKKVISKLKDSRENSVLILGATKSVKRNRDTSYPYRPCSNMLYLTGYTGDEALIFFSSSLNKPIIFAYKTDPKKAIWEGKSEEPKKLADRLQADLVISNDPLKEIYSKLSGIETLYYQNEQNSLGYLIAKKVFELQSHERGSYPKKLLHLDNIIERMRLFKDEEEVNLIESAAAITNEGLKAIIPLISEGVTEAQIKAGLDYTFRSYGAENSFQSIVASGKSASVLHYSAHDAVLKKGELLLIDCGAEYKYYAGDITRTLPVSGKFSDVQKILYNGVLQAQYTAFESIKAGVTMESVYKNATYRLIEALIEAKVLKGKVKSIYEKKEFIQYFPHGLGHTLGIDVHDVGNVRANNNAILEEGMVITIEPGLYFQKGVGKIKPMGIRIEDDVLVTKDGCEILSEGFPKEVNEIEELFS